MQFLNAGLLDGSQVEEALSRIQDFGGLRKDNDVTAITGLELFRQDLSPILAIMAPTETPLRNRFGRQPGNGGAHEWNRLVRTTGPDGSPFIGGTTVADAFFAKGNLPTATNPTYEHVSAPYKLFGDIAQVTDFDQRASASYIGDLMAHRLEVAMLNSASIEEWTIINGNRITAPLQFDGLIRQCDQNNRNIAGAQVALSDFSAICESVFNAGGHSLVAVMSTRVKRKVNDIILTTFFGIRQTNMLSGFAKLASGMNVGMWDFGFGEIELMMHRYMRPGAGESGGSNERVLILDDQSTDKDGNVISMVDLLPMESKPLARLGTSERILVQEYTLLKVTSPLFQGQITNIGTPTLVNG